MIDEGNITFKAEFFLCLLFYYLNIYLFCAIVIIDNEGIEVIQMYYLMNKNNIVATFDKGESTGINSNTFFEIKETFGLLPYGFDGINSWIENRKSSKHNTHLKEIMKELGCYSNEGFIRITHASTINDSFWIKSDTEKISWEQVSLYRNQFNEIVSKLAFEGVGLYEAILSSTSPELACDGSFRKCFRKENSTGQFGSDIFIYKRGSEGSSNSGLEPYSEMLSSEIAQIISPSSVSYELVTLHNQIATRCNLFTNEKYGFVPLKKLMDTKERKLSDVLDFFYKHDSEQTFREMMIIDALCFNEDRHTGNFGMLFDNDTLKITHMSPIFDLNITLLTYAKDEKLFDMGNTLYALEPVFGEDFTRMGQDNCNDVIRDRLKDIKDFSFSFRGDDVFSPNRVKMLEAAIRTQAEAILSKEKLKTTDVFISSERIKLEQREAEFSKAKERADFFEQSINSKIGKDFFTSISEANSSVQCIIENIEGTFAMTIDFSKYNVSIKFNNEDISMAKLKTIFPSAYKVCFESLKKLKKTHEFKEKNKHLFKTSDSLML